MFYVGGIQFDEYGVKIKDVWTIEYLELLAPLV